MRVYTATIERLRAIKASGRRIAITSFRRAGQNREHQFLSQIEAALRTIEGWENVYFHCQSRFDNSLFRNEGGEPTSRGGYMEEYKDLGGFAAGAPIMKNYW